MKVFCEKYGITYNIFVGVLCLFPVVALIALLWWGKYSSEEKKTLLNILFGALIICAVNIIPFIGQIAAVVWLVFYVIFFVKSLMGKETSIPVAKNIADAIVK